MASILEFARSCAHSKEAIGVADVDLLDRFVQTGDESAFELLVWRYADLVHGVCRRVLRHTEDAEDAFQATFLTLARKASTIKRRERLSSWLYRVAFHAAVDARTLREKRTVSESTFVDACETRRSDNPVDSAEVAEFQSTVDEAIHALPGRQRAAVILCCLQGMSNAEAAKVLGCSLGTIHSRLSRARRMLRVRLQRRGLSFAVSILSAGIPSSTARAGLVRSALQHLAGNSPNPNENTIILAKGVAQTMFIEQLRNRCIGCCVLTALIVLAVAALANRPVSHGAPAIPSRVENRGTKKKSNSTPDVKPKRFRVLVLEDAPRYETRFLNATLIRHPQFDASVVWAKADPITAAKQIPRSQKALDRYDVVVVGDLSPAFVKKHAPAFMRHLEKAVLRGQLGLVIMPGRSFQTTPELKRMLPVRLGKKFQQRGIPVPYRPTLTPDAKNTPFMALRADWPSSRKLWEKQLPKFYGYFRDTSRKPNATVLAVVPATHAGKKNLPVIATSYYGRGRSVFLGVDEFWRWRQLDDTFYQRFWTHLLHHAVTARPVKK